MAMISFSSSLTVPATAAAAAGAVVASLQTKRSLQHRVLNSLPLIQCHNSRALRLSAARTQGVRVPTTDGGGGGRRVVATSEERLCSARATKSTSLFVARAAGAAEVAAEESIAAAATPGESLDEVKRTGGSYFLTDSRPVILFDGVCNMCNSGVNFMLDNDPKGKLRFAALQSEAGMALLVRSGRARDDMSSIVLVDKDRSYRKSEAILRIGQYLGFPYTPAAFLGLLFPLFVRDHVYDTVADNRYSVYGKTDACRLSDPRFAERFVD